MSNASDDEFHNFMTGRWPSLVRTAYLLTGSHHDAEDLAQSALTRAYAKWDKVRHSDDMAAYVRRIMIHVHADGFRRRTVREWFTSRLPETAVADRTAQVEHRSALVDALARLPLRQRSAVVLRYFEDMTPAQIAAAWGTRESTVRSQITRGLAGLRDDGVLAALAGDPQEARTQPSDSVALKGMPR
ncbi:SigE family RNA polymerase sigma factor [Streptomyces sp. PKU-EA00015]|uniref:SigE family RNA polymerase sigma factor n=1 Tax=Streptomyces sp. PKU-EA00015 TaxID=2748326 RepID=UPI00210DEBCE|nr:SigE family RNA polymerase sigma factor [Streptomyces sp. PKU-EA00015]